MNFNKCLSFNYELDCDKFKDECGVFGVYSDKRQDTCRTTYYGLYSLQHRGQESAGIATSNGEQINIHKGLGLITEAFKEDSFEKLKGNISIGHVRYSTTGDTTTQNAQPLIDKSRHIAMAHNGNLINIEILKELLESNGYKFDTTIDTEVLMALIERSIETKGFEKSIIDSVQAIKGSFALVFTTKNKLIGVRDPYGIRPLCLGKLDDDYILSSESCAIEAIGGELIRDIEAGEIIIIDENGYKSIKYCENTFCQTCTFEYVYFARPDSVIDGLSVQETRVKFGEKLFEQYPIKADVVSAVPDSGISAAIGYARASKIPFDNVFIKNRYVGRTFIVPTQEDRERILQIKLNPLNVNVENKSIVLIDDSIVRGTTSKYLVNSLRKAGAKEIYLLIASPVVKYPCYFGIDTPYRSQLIGANYSIKEIGEIIGVDSIGYLSIDGMQKCLEPKKGVCLGCFNGIYPVSTSL